MNEDKDDKLFIVFLRVMMVLAVAVVLVWVASMIVLIIMMCRNGVSF